MRVLFVSPRDSWPPKSGARLRDFHFARALAARTELTYIYFAEDPALLPQHLSEARAVIPVETPKKYTPLKILKGLLGTKPLPVQNYSSGAMDAAIRSALPGDAFDLFHLDSIHLCSYIPTIRALAPSTAIVLDWHNIESELMSRYAASCTSPLRRLYARETVRRLFSLETQMLRGLSGHIVCSDRERSELLARIPAAHVAVFENGVDTQYFRPGTSASASHRVIFVGQMSYHANASAAIWFADAIWPAVRERFPELQLEIVGSDPTAAVRALAQRPGISVTGTVLDVLPYYQNAFASIVPLQSGGGTRLKILEAMAAGTPVISTPIGAEGLDIAHQVHFLLARETPYSWLDAFGTLSDQNRRSILAAAARELVCRRYDWEIIGQRLADFYESLANASSGSSSRRSSIQ